MQRIGLHEEGAARFPALTADASASAEEAMIVSSLKNSIERICNRPVLYGDHALTPRGTRYAVICNGAIKQETADAAPLRALREMASDSLKIANILRAQIDSEAYLIWRCVPEITNGVLYMRLAFEPVQ